MSREIIELNDMTKLVNVDCRVARAKGEVVDDRSLDLNPTHGGGDLRDHLVSDIFSIISVGIR